MVVYMFTGQFIRPELCPQLKTKIGSWSNGNGLNVSQKRQALQQEKPLLVLEISNNDRKSPCQLIALAIPSAIAGSRLIWI